MGRNPIEGDKESKADKRIAELTRELAEAINDSKSGGRGEARDYAIDLLKDEVETEVVEPSSQRGPGDPPGPMNPFALGLPFLLIGVILMPLFSIVGLGLAGIGFFMCLVGVGMAITGSRSKGPPKES